MENMKIVVGSPNFGKGQTNVTISNNGLISATNICHKDTAACKLELSEADVKETLSLIQNRIKAIPSSKKRKGVPGEAEYHIEIFVKEGETLQYHLWDNDISKDKELKKVFSQLRENIFKNSEQKIVL